MASTSDNQTPSPSASTSPPTLWDVFLSFRGTDTRYTFTDHLYKALHRTGIRTFKDNPELRSGEVISDSLIQAITESKTYIVVLSENYASSSWCLDELVEILDCYKRMKRLVVPVFYNIDPSVVRHQVGSFKEAFEKHQTRFGVVKVNKWRSTLKEVADFSGFHISRNRYKQTFLLCLIVKMRLDWIQTGSCLSKAILTFESEQMASSSYSQTPSSLTPTSPSTLWDVFLSFSGPDTRYTFTDHLYKALQRTGIRTFRDDPELRSGEIISRALPQAIWESRTYIVVLSENYASSSWCLDELVEILDCYRRMKRLVVPVFYNIDPSVVRHQVESFKEAFEKHQTRFVKEKVDKWRGTLKEVADFSGYHISKNRSEADLIDEVVARVLVEINPTTLDVTRYPVGLDSRVKGVTALFNSNIEGVIRIGIHGMGGIGKTTLAKAVYKQNYHRFQGSSFLSNVREVSRTKGLVCLQQQLINDVLKRKDVNIDSVDQGIELIRARICSTKVLVVIDDIDDPKPLKYLEGSFALGSTVIITTRNEDLLDRINVKAKYKVNQMDKDESHQLFTQHAFREDKMSEPFTELSKEILERAGGLPLALQVFGSTLHNESEEGWRWFIDKLKGALVGDIEENLMISFDALKLVDPNLQDIFLDIACFYIGRKKDEVIKILEACYTFVNHKIDILKKRCLITIDDGDKLGMHDLLQDMGSGIARNNSPDEPGKHSRLWDLDVIYSVLKKDKGTEAIKGIRANYSSWFLENARKVSFAAETFKRMSKLKFLYLEDVNITGSFEQTFEDLRWLCWKKCPLECLPSGFYPENLVILELPRSEIKIMWEVSQVFGKLKTLKMPDSRNLTTTPDFTELPCLETLDLNGCIHLEHVHVSIGRLVKLVYLNLGYCENLRNLPDSIRNLRSLEILDVNGCGKLEELPDQVGMITSLRELNVKQTRRLKVLPDISRLTKIERLDLSFCHHLLSIAELPPNLKRIDAYACVSMERLPNLSNLKQLEILKLTNCKAMERLPNLSNLKQLEELNLKGCSSLTEIQGLGELTSLTVIMLDGCRKLLSIAEYPPNLKWIDVYDCGSMERLPNLSNFTQLEELNLKGCSSLTEIQGLGELTSLIHLRLNGCRKLLSIAELPPNLKRIDAYDCRSMERLPNLSNLKQLEILDLTNCRSMERLPNLSNLKQLKELILECCSGLTEIQGLEGLISLRKLSLFGVAYTLTRRFFQILSGFGHQIEIRGPSTEFRGPSTEFPDWISQSSECVSRMSLDLQPNASRNFLAIILVFKYSYFFNYFFKNITSGFAWGHNFFYYTFDNDYIHDSEETVIVIVPSSIFSITNGDDRIELTSNKKNILGIHLLYKTEITMISEHDSTIVNVESYPSKRLK